ncbi:hypothetical protein Poli38472_011732 [Pythium oligandrum]|uniref:RGS domain-containing protein n=1 Tax=Pythium oligandrum TaxID=41045 RepID=A0A8K1C809_PYTOL|nr:hypothetical protein Poli38472_011732 [Pythium oligandrum]|eukprot:TMW58144.1 hypothetical protein Poli38472_011732 [Pythium oligandrum]
MGVCLGKLCIDGNAVAHSNAQGSPVAAQIDGQTVSTPVNETTTKSKNLVVPHPQTPTSATTETKENGLSPAKSSRSIEDMPAKPRLQRSHTMSANNMSAKLKPMGSQKSGLNLTSPMPTVPARAETHVDDAAIGKAKTRHLSVRPPVQDAGSASKGLTLPRPKKVANVSLDVLIKDERARVGFFRYLALTAVDDTKKVETDPTVVSNEHVSLKRRASKMTQTRMTIDYREDCVLFWLEISDLLKIPSGGSFQLGLMEDLYDVYVTKNAPRLLPMVTAVERESLAQFLQDRNAERALLAYKMILLDVLEIVTASFDEYVRADGKLGYVYATKADSMRNVLARIAKVNVGPASNDRRVYLNEIINTPPVCRMFREFLQERNSVENLLFIIDALAFEDLVNTFESERDPSMESDETSRHDYCLRQAQKIFNKYIRYGSKAEICLGAAVKEKLLQEIVEYPIGAQVFNEAVLLCSAELVQSHLDMFHRSHAYIQFQLAKTESAAVASGNQRRRSALTTRRTSYTKEGSAGSDESAPAAPMVETPLNDILNSVGVNFFREFLREDGVENVLFFYKEVEQFQLLPHGQKHYIQSKARKIFDRFVRRGGKLEIDLPVDVRRDILFRLASPSEFTFVDALKYVVNQWEYKYLPKFREHRLYPEMQTALQAAPPSITSSAPTVETNTRRESVNPQAVVVPQPSTAPSAVASGDWVDVTRITLCEFLDLEFLRKFFRHFLEKEQCVNELHFYLEILNFQQLPTSDYLTRQAKKLYNRFCDPQSRECVTLRDELRLVLQQSLENARPAMFNKAHDEILTFFQSTLFPKFQQSETYRTVQMTHSQLRSAKHAAMGDDIDNEPNQRGPGRLGFFGDSNANKGDKNGTSPRKTSTTIGIRRRNSIGGVAPPPAELCEADITVTMILEHPETRPLFLFFSEEIFCTESIYFWLDCNEYKDIPHRNYLKLRAQKIYRKYISGRAKLQVNLDSTIIKEIIKHLDDPPRNLFVPAQRSITKMLERDTLPKFQKSKHFQPCLAILRNLAT